MSAASLVLLAAVVANGLLTGASLDQSIKQLPARHRMGAVAFARYSQAADLSNGVAWYAVLGIGTALLTLTAAALELAARPSPGVAAAMVVAIVATLCHSVTTAVAAPTNFSQRKVAGDEAALEAVFDRFTRWQTVRVAAQVVTLLAVASAIALA